VYLSPQMVSFMSSLSGSRASSRLGAAAAPLAEPSCSLPPTSSPLKELGSEWPSHLKVIRQLGKGSYGTVHLCEDRNTGAQVAVKHVKQAARHGKSMVREIRLLARMKHENLLHLMDIPAVPSPNFEDVFLVLPYMPADLHKVIQSKQTLSERHVQAIMAQLFRALEQLHACGVAHRDLKPANILLSADCKLKICDFGLARGEMPLQCSADGDDDEPPRAEARNGVLTEYVVTRWYRAPEVMLLPKQYTSAVDIWSAGCILCEIMGRKPLFPGKNHVDMVTRVAQTMGAPADDELRWLPKDSDAYRFVRRVCPQKACSPLATLYPRAEANCLDLVRGLLRWDPSRRNTAASAQEHPYLRTFLGGRTPPRAEPFDWSFDGFRPTTDAVRQRLYNECARFHPEIRDRDRVHGIKSAPTPARADSTRSPSASAPARRVRAVPAPPSHPRAYQVLQSL